MLLLMLIPPPGLLDRVDDPLFRGVFLPLASNHPLLNLLIHVLFHFFLPLITDIKQSKSIIDEIFLNVPIKRSISSEARSVVNFQQVGSQLMIQHNVESQHLEAHVISEVVRMHQRYTMTQSRIASYYRLYENFIDSLFKGPDIVTFLLNTLVNRSQRSFVTHIHLIYRIIEDKIRVFLIDSVVSQVHKLVVQVLGTRWAVLLGCKSSQPLLKHEDSQRVDARYQDINPEIELESVNQVGLVHISLNDAPVVFEF